MRSSWRLGRLSLKQLARRVWSGIFDDNIFGYSAQLAYYFLLGLFPLLLILTTLFGFFTQEGTELRKDLFTYLAQVMPYAAFTLVRDTIDDIGRSASGGKVWLGIVAGLWAASNGMIAIIDALNAAYRVKEKRAWWKRRLVAIGLTIALAFLITTALTLVLYGGKIGDTLASGYRLGNAFAWTWKIAQWPIILAFVFVAFSLIYSLAPDIHGKRFRLITPGSAVAVGLWLLVSFALRLYFHYFNTYSATYGSLGAVIILMLWFYLTGAAILIGGEINSEIETTPLAKKSDAKESGAPVSE
jgi:membrane protein